MTAVVMEFALCTDDEDDDNDDNNNKDDDNNNKSRHGTLMQSELAATFCKWFITVNFLSIL